MTMKIFEGYWEDLSIPKKWENSSYHHDACPSWFYNGLQIFVDHPNPKERECGEDKVRFCVFNEDQDELFYSESFEETQLFVENYKEQS